MNRRVRNFFLIGVIITYGCLINLPTSTGQSISNIGSPARQSRRLTLKQIEALVKGTPTAKPTPDEIIAQEILERSVEFQVDEEMLGNLSAKGAGRATLDALRKVRKRALRSGTTTVLLADFKGVNGEDIGLTEIFSDKLSDAVSNYKDVKVVYLGESITAARGGSEGALEKGREHNASIVLWGWFVRSSEKILVTVNFEVLKSPHSVTIGSEKGSYRAAVSTLNEFTLQGELSKELTTIILAATALTRMDVGDYGGAANRLNQALESHVSPQMVMGSDDIFLYSCLAYILAATADPESVKFLPTVITNLEAHVKNKPKSALGYQLLSLAHLLTSGQKEALEYAHKALEATSDPHMQSVAYQLMMYCSDLKDQNQDAIEYAKKRLQILESGDLGRRDYEGIGETYAFLGDNNKALVNFQKALVRTTDPMTLARIHFGKAHIYYDEDSSIDQALKEFEDGIELNPRNFDAHMKVGNIYFWREDYLRAIAHYTRVINLRPKNAEAYANRGNAYKELPDLASRAQALSDYEQSLTLDPKYGPAYLGRGLWYLDVEHRSDKALTDLNKGLEFEPNDIDALYARAGINADTENYDAAISDYTAIIKTEPKDARAYFYRGLVQNYERGDAKKLADFDAAIKLRPDYAEVYLERSSIYALEGDPQRAKLDILRVLKLSKEPALRQRAIQQLNQLTPNTKRRKRASPKTFLGFSNGPVVVARIIIRK